MRKRKRRRCKCCYSFFLPRPGKNYQLYCSAPECQKESHRESSRRYWRKKSCESSDFLKSERERLREYRKRKCHARKKSPISDIQTATASPGKTASKDESVRDVKKYYIACFVGFMSYLGDGTLDETLKMAGKFHDRGVSLLEGGNGLVPSELSENIASLNSDHEKQSMGTCT